MRVNNAAVLKPGDRTPLSVPPEDLLATLRTNVVAPLRLMQAVLPGMRERRHGRIVNVSSSWGSLADTADPAASPSDLEAPAYRASKAALNMLTLMVAREAHGSGVLVNACCPGWVRTAMGGLSAGAAAPAAGAVPAAARPAPGPRRRSRPAAAPRRAAAPP